MAFLVLSEALTGVRVSSLAPEFTENKADVLKSDPGVDPFNIKNEYFAWINFYDGPTFERLLEITKAHSTSIPDIITAVNASDDTKFLARSIVLLWYLGSWYKPEDLKKNAAPGPVHSSPPRSFRRRRTPSAWSGKSHRPTRWATATCNSVTGRGSLSIPTTRTLPLVSSPQRFPEGASHGRQ